MDQELREQLEQLLAKWREDRATYPDEQFGAQYAAIAVKLCEDELRSVLNRTRQLVDS